jgi:Mrp family chromosome partitioning ATPase/capsular polysaccharide biosynthesis protein
MKHEPARDYLAGSDAAVTSVLAGPVRFYRRQKWLLIWMTAAFAVLGAAYALTRQPTYTARALLVVENTRLESARQELIPTSAAPEASTVDTQVEILKSQLIALKAIEALRLTADAAFLRPSQISIVERLRAAVLTWGDHPDDELAASQSGAHASEPAPAPPNPAALLLPAFHGSLSVKRVGLSAIIEVSFRSSDPERAAQAVNAVIQAYMADQSTAAAASVASATAWLRERLKDVGPRTRLVSPALTPIQKDGPRALVLVGLFSGFGLLTAVAVGAGRTIFDNTLRDPPDVEAELRLPFLAAVGNSRTGSLDHLTLTDLDYAASAIVGTAAAAGAEKLIGLISATRGEGVTTVAKHLATYLGASGRRVLLVDANTDSPELTQQLVPEATLGLTDVLTAELALANAVWKIKALGIDFLPAGRERLRMPDFTFEAKVAGWSKLYDHVIVDLPPLMTLARTLQGMVQNYVLVVRWARTPSHLVDAGLHAATGGNRRGCLGFMFNRVVRSQADATGFPAESHRWKHERRYRAST